MKKVMAIVFLISSLAFSQQYGSFSYVIQEETFSVCFGYGNTGVYIDDEVVFGYDLVKNRSILSIKEGYNLENAYNKLKYLTVGVVARIYLPKFTLSEEYNVPENFGIFIQRSDNYSILSLEFPVWTNDNFKLITTIPWTFRIGIKF